MKVLIAMQLCQHLTMQSLNLKPFLLGVWKLISNKFIGSFNKKKRNNSYSYVKITKDGSVLLLLRFLNRCIGIGIKYAMDYKIKKHSMNYSKKTAITFILAAFVMASTSFAQKFGHINSQQLLIESPLVKDADSKLKVFQDDLIGKGKEMVKSFEANYSKYVEEVQGGGLNKIQMGQREAELGKSQEAIKKYELEVQQKIGLKREELYAPILEQAKVAIEAIGKEGNYTMVFDTGTNGLLFAIDSENLLQQVKTKLGW